MNNCNDWNFQKRVLLNGRTKYLFNKRVSSSLLGNGITTAGWMSLVISTRSSFSTGSISVMNMKSSVEFTGSK